MIARLLRRLRFFLSSRRRRMVRPIDPVQVERIAAITEARAINWSAVARKIGLDHSSVWFTLHGRRRNPETRLKIAHAVGLRPEELWPDMKPRRAA